MKKKLFKVVHFIEKKRISDYFDKPDGGNFVTRAYSLVGIKY